MPRKRRKFQRPLGQLRYRKLFVIAVEGASTEPQYFTLLNQQSVINVKCLKGKNESSPPQVLKRMERYLKEASLRKTDEAWLVCDKDQWTDEQLLQLYSWSQHKANYGFALSNPNFEYWLLLHFEEGNGVSTTHDCLERLKRHLPDYDKNLNARKISHDMIADAIRRAKQRDTPPCIDWPRTIGTTVYKLVERILEEQSF
jgi:uncharacterized protein YpiB (UPF0302 family)